MKVPLLRPVEFDPALAAPLPLETESLLQKCGSETRAQRGFSLIELLVVVAIIGVLAAFAVPAFNSIGQARGVSEAAYQLAAAVELARSEAVSRQTYVWLGLQQVTNAGNPAVRIGAVFSRDGSSTNTNGSNLQPIGKALLVDRVLITNAAGLSTSASLAGSTDFSSAPAGLGFSIGQTSFSGRPTITFLPGGEATLTPSPGPATGFTPRLAIGLGLVRGNAVSGDNASAVIIDGSTAIPTIYRP